MSAKAQRHPVLAGPLGSLALSCVRPRNATAALRAVRWHDGLARLGLVLPFFVIHDFGFLFALPREQLLVGQRVSDSSLSWPVKRPPGPLRAAYAKCIEEIGQCEAASNAGRLRLSDDLIIAILSRLLGGMSTRLGIRAPGFVPLPSDPSLFEDLDAKLPMLFKREGRRFEVSVLEGIVSSRLFLLTVADALDADTLRLFGMLGTDASAGAMAQVDLIAALESPEANDIVSFSLEILPSVLETKTRAASGTVAAHGYSGLGTRGSIDSMVLTELAWDDAELARRLLDHEVLYFAREQSREEQRRVHYLLIDASASMRGDRTTFARGMALATGKKLLLEGEEVVFRFFDSRLYEPARARGGELPTALLLSFRGERGRNPGRVFAELSTDLELLRMRDHRSPVVHLFTHAALYIPREMVQAVRAQAHLAVVFMLPSDGKLELSYLDLLDAYWVVDHTTLAERDARKSAAESILGESAMEQNADEPSPGAPRSRRAPGLSQESSLAASGSHAAPRSQRSSRGGRTPTRRHSGRGATGGRDGEP